MLKLEIIAINNFDYMLRDVDTLKRYNLNLEFYNTLMPNIHDLLYIDEDIIRENTFYTFGKINKKDNNIKDKDLIKIVSKDNEYYLQRYYG